MEGLTGGAYFFAFLGFLLMIVVGWLLIPRASFVVTMAILANKLGFVNFNQTQELYIQVIWAITIFMIAIGLMIDLIIIKEYFE